MLGLPQCGMCLQCESMEELRLQVLLIAIGLHWEVRLRNLLYLSILTKEVELRRHGHG